MDADLIVGIFLRMLGLLIAFQFLTTSFQLSAIIGPRGLEPVRYLIHAFRRDHGCLKGFMKLPTVFWVGSSERFIQMTTYAGTGLGLALAFGLGGNFQWFLVACAWFLWLSILNASPSFFYYPWDVLLLETLLITVAAPKLALLPELKVVEATNPLLLTGYLVLLFRVMLGMGLSKFRVRDARTKDGSYIYHFLEWQPMATAFAQISRTLPMVIHRLSLKALFIIECILPFCLFGPSTVRNISLIAFVGLQAKIMLNGNYGIFNLLTALLALPAFAFSMDSLGALGALSAVDYLLLCHILLGIPHALFLDSWTSNAWAHAPKTVAKENSFLQKVITIFRILKPFGFWHGYGVFVPRGNFQKVISVIQMQDQSGHWHEVEPRYLTNRCDKRPPRFAPYHPRLDHHLYYIHLRPKDLKVSCLMGTHPYYVNEVSVIDKLVEHLYRGSENVKALFKSVPVHKPNAIRIAAFEYVLLSPSETKTTGKYWSRQEIGITTVFPRLELNENTGIQSQYDPFVYDTYDTTSRDYSTATYAGETFSLHRVRFLLKGHLDDGRLHPYFRHPSVSTFEDR